MSQVMKDMYDLADIRYYSSKGEISKRPDVSAMAGFGGDDDEFRYVAEYTWNAEKPTLVGIFLNPSTATHLKLDPTISGMCDRARGWGYGSYRQINAFAFRATDPKIMMKADDPVGPSNDAVIRAVIRRAKRQGAKIIAGWGKDGKFRGRDKEIMKIFEEARFPLYALRVNGDGSPGHPLYIPRAQKPVIYYEWKPTFRQRPRPCNPLQQENS